MRPDPDTTSERDTDDPAASDGSIRGAYESLGVDGYYRGHGREYRNPHEPAVCHALEVAVGRWPLDLSRVLDLAAGSGEVTLALRELGAGEIDGFDPFTFDAYAARTGSVAGRFTFEDVAGGALAGHAYSLVVCSYALHLCEPSRLPGVAYALSLVAPALLVLTPHKRPVLRAGWGWSLAGEVVVDRVRTRWYRSESPDPD